MSNFDDYLKKVYMEWDPKRFQQAKDDGLLDDPKNSVAEEIPRWLIKDADRGGAVFKNIEEMNKFSPAEIRKKLINYLRGERGILNISQSSPPEKKALRFVITKNGDVFWSHSSDSIHIEIIAYGMLVGKIPQKEFLSFYQWSEPGTYKHSLDYFICLEKKGKLFLAESYIMGKNIGPNILSYLKELPKNHPYIKIPSEIGIFYPKALGQE